MIDLLQYSGQGGCSAKIPQDKLMEIISSFTPLRDSNVLVDTSTSDDAGVYRISDDMALIVTTDFFPPVCSDPYVFGQIAAANSLSDVYAMGGKPLLVLNLNMFPSDKLPMEALGQIMAGGASKIEEAHALIMGGHTINDDTPKYGLAVVGVCHPDKIATNDALEPNQTLILTKPLGVGVMIAAKRLGIADETSYMEAIDSMRTLNDKACEVMQKYGVKAATDITGFGLIGHLNKMAMSSDVTIQIDCSELQLIDGVEAAVNSGCVPSTAMRNMKSVGDDAIFARTVPLSRKIAVADAQTSGGILMAVDNSIAAEVLEELWSIGAKKSAIIGSSVKKQAKRLYFY
ncbi:MAG: selenide, water dikinase SelD [Rikenellaceae bacterium]